MCLIICDFSMWLLIILGIVIDQLIKLAVVSTFVVGEGCVLFPGLHITLAMNRGVAFSMFADLIGTNFYFLNMMIVLFNWILLEVMSTTGDDSKWSRFALGLVITGGLSNLVDRVCYGAVVDYIHLSYAGWDWPTVFNLADVFISVGCALLVLCSFMASSQRTGSRAKGLHSTH